MHEHGPGEDLRYLRGALAEVLGIVDGVGGAPNQVGLAAAAGYLLRTDGSLEALGRAAARTALRRTGPVCARAEPAAWRSIVRDLLVPDAELACRRLESFDVADPAALQELRATLHETVEAAYRGDPSGDVWWIAECLVRALEARERLGSADVGGEVARSARSHTIAAVDESARRWARMLRLDHGRRPAERSLDNPWDVLAYEAMADSLASPSSVALTDDLYDAGFVDRHRGAVAEVLGEPVMRPIVAMADDRWLRELHPGRLGASGVHIRGLAILLSRSTALEANQQRASSGRLNATLVHELIHATQRSRHGPLRKPPYSALTADVERKMLEGMTEYFTLRVLEQQRSSWRGDRNPYSPEELRGTTYYAWSFVAVSSIALGFPDHSSDAALKEFSYNPHKLTNLSMLLTGDYSADRKQDLAVTLEGLFSFAESIAKQPSQVERDVRAQCERDLGAYRARYRP